MRVQDHISKTFANDVFNRRLMFNAFIMQDQDSKVKLLKKFKRWNRRVWKAKKLVLEWSESFALLEQEVMAVAPASGTLPNDTGIGNTV